MNAETSKKLKTYLGIALWAVVVCSLITFWIVESVLLLKGHKNGTDSSERVIHVKTLLDTMMMDQIGNKFFDTLVVMKTPNNTVDRFRQIDKARHMLDRMMDDF